jgi:hypothetical protein
MLQLLLPQQTARPNWQYLSFGRMLTHVGNHFAKPPCWVKKTSIEMPSFEQIRMLLDLTGSSKQLLSVQQRSIEVYEP